ncbi:MAG: hypothetical protein DMD78_08140 [Candidatus Rokuibacteriota bacterium]|nr:MAG: hypothetical protein DMD78_08140 [Candidatus Rokubacteria bacterium]
MAGPARMVPGVVGATGEAMISPTGLRLTTGVIALAVATTSCASTGSLTVVPTRGQDSEQMQRDRAECDELAKRGRDRTVFFKTKVAGVVAGIIVGAGLGLLGLFASGKSASTREAPGLLAAAAGGGAAVGFVIGDIGGSIVGVKEHRKQETAYVDRYVRCLDARGYRVSP